MRKNKLWKRRCQKRHADLTYLGRDNADHIVQELQRQFKWAPQLGSWERAQWELTPEERRRRDQTEDLVFERKIKGLNC